MADPSSIRFPVLAVLVGLVTALGSAGGPAVAQSGPDRPPELALIPGEAIGFVHVRVADVWRHDAMAEQRKTILRAGPKAFAAFDEQFVPTPSTIDRVTGVLLVNPQAPDLPLVAYILTFNAPYDAAKVRSAYLPGGTPRRAGEKEYFQDDRGKLAVYFPDDRTLVVGDGTSIPMFLASKARMTRSVLDGAAGKSMFAAVNLSKVPFPPKLTDSIPPDLEPLLRAEHLMLSVDLQKEATVHARLSYSTADDASAAMAAARRAAVLGRKLLQEPRREAEAKLYRTPKDGKPRPLGELPDAVTGLAALGMLNTIDEILAAPPLSQDGTVITAMVKLPPWTTQYLAMVSVTAGMALPALKQARDDAGRSLIVNVLRQISLAMHNHESAFGNMPPAAIADENGRKLLSWRVKILPYLGHDGLYFRFRQNEPWDSENNKKLIPLMPRTYADPRVPAEEGKTHYKVFVGKDAGFDWVKGRKSTDVPDGTANTIMVIAGGEPVIWTKPDDIEFDADKPLPDLSKPFDDVFVAMFDGSIRLLKPDLPEKVLKDLIRWNDGKPIDPGAVLIAPGTVIK